MTQHKPASAPDVIPPRKPEELPVGSESEGSNALQHEPNPDADRAPERSHTIDGRKVRGPYPTGNT